MGNMHLSSRGAAVARFAKRPLVLFLIAAALLAVLAVAERQGGSSIGDSSDIVRRRDFSSVFANVPSAGLARPVQVPSAGRQGAPEILGVDREVTAATAVTTAQQVADTAMSRADGAATAAVAAQQAPPFVAAIVCPILLQARAQVVSTINALIAAFPFLAPQLTAIREAALARINAQLAQFGCPVPS